MSKAQNKIMNKNYNSTNNTNINFDLKCSFLQLENSKCFHVLKKKKFTHSEVIL